MLYNFNFHTFLPNFFKYGAIGTGMLTYSDKSRVNLEY